MERNIETYEDLMDVFKENEASYFSFVYQSIMVHDFPNTAATTYDIIKEYLPRFFQSLNLKPTLPEYDLKRAIEESKGYKIYIEWQEKWLLDYKKKNIFDSFSESIESIVRKTRLDGKPLNQCYCRILSAHYIYRVLVNNELNEDFIYKKLLRTIPVEELNSWYKDDARVYENIFNSAKVIFNKIGVKNLNNDLLYEILMNSNYIRKLKEKHPKMIEYLKSQSKTSIINLKITKSIYNKEEVSSLKKIGNAGEPQKTSLKAKIKDNEVENGKKSVLSPTFSSNDDLDDANERKVEAGKKTTDFDKQLDDLLKRLGTGNGEKDSTSDFLLDIGNTLFDLSYK